MATLWKILKPGDKEKLSQAQRDWFGKKLIPPKDLKPIQYPVKIEGISELDKIMREKPRSGRE